MAKRNKKKSKPINLRKKRNTVATARFICKDGLIHFNSKPFARETLDAFNKELKKEGRKSRITYRIYGKGRNTVAFVKVVTPRRRKRR